MALPNVNIAIQDGALGLVPAQSTNVVCCAGTCSGGVNNTVYSFGAGNVQAIVAALGTGPLVDQMALIAAAGAPVMGLKVNGSIAGTIGAVTKTGVAGASVMTVPGVPTDAFDLKVLIVQPGALPSSLTASFKYSLDGGLTYSNEIAMPASGTYLMPNTGITLTWSALTIGAGDIYTATAVAPGFTTTDLSNATTVLFADPRTWFMLQVVGTPADVATMQGFYAAVESQMQAQAAVYRFAGAQIAAPDGIADAAMLTGLSTLSGTRTGIACGSERLISPTTGMQIRRNCGFSIAKRLASIPISEDAGRVATGAAGAEVVSLIRDEGVTPGLDAAGASTMRTFVGLPGFYITAARIKSSPVSDYQYWQNRRVMDVACATARVALLRFLNSSLLINRKTGTIDEGQAQQIEAYVTSALRAVLTRPGQATDVSVLVGRVNNILSDSTLYADIRVIPLGYARYITTTIGFFNPGLQPTA